MKIGIIGAGHIGTALTHRFRAAGYDVAIANQSNADALHKLAEETGATPVSVREAVRDKDLIVVTIPEKKISDLPDDLFASVPSSVPVVDTGNYYPQQRDGAIDEIEAGMAESRWVEMQLEHPVIKAFNNIYAQHLQDNGKPKGDQGRLALPVAGDDAAAKARVMALVDEIGFDAVDAGSLDESWRQQPGSPVYGGDNSIADVKAKLAQAKPERAPEWRAVVSIR